MRLNGMSGIVTGGARGIGFGIATEMAREGCTVIIADLDGEAARSAAGALTERGARAFAITCDLSRPEDAARMVEEAVALASVPDVVVNNAGICPFRPFLEVTPEDWFRTLNTNLGGPFFVSQAAARHMVPRGRGSIVNIASISVRIGNPQQVHYCASKGGLASMTHAMATALGPSGIRVNAILSGGIPTDINREQYTTEYVQWLTGRLPLRRMGQPEDIGRAVVFLASDDSLWVTGALLPVDGGRLVTP